MARNNRHNAAFVVGAVLGGLAGAAAALWKTPYSGEELRAKIAGGEPASVHTGSGATATPGQGRSFAGKVLSTVEHTLAPIVGVELGKTANNSGPLTTMTDRDAPGHNVAPMGAGEVVVEQAGVSGDQDAGEGELANVTPTEPVADHIAATVEDLTHPHAPLAPDATRHDEARKTPFPRLGGNEPQNR